MKIYLFISLYFLPFSGFAQQKIDSMKARQAVNYINWAFTNNIVEQLPRNEEWKYRTIPSLNNAPTYKELRVAFDDLEPTISFKKYFTSVSTKIIDDKGNIRRIMKGDTAVKSLINELVSAYEDNYGSFKIDATLVQEITSEINVFLYKPNDTAKESKDNSGSATQTYKGSSKELAFISIGGIDFSHGDIVLLVLVIILFIWCSTLSVYLKSGEKFNTQLQGRLNSQQSEFNHKPFEPRLSKFGEAQLYEKLKNELLVELKAKHTPEALGIPLNVEPNNIPINNISAYQPVIYYFAAPTTTGFNDDYKSNEIVDQTSLYLLEVDHTQQSGTFKLLNEPWVMRYALNERRDYIDPVCRIQGIFTQRAISVQTLKPGSVTLSDGKWTVSEKALIEYV